MMTVETTLIDAIVNIELQRDAGRQIDQHVLIHVTEGDGNKAYWVVQNVNFPSMVELVDHYLNNPLVTKDGDEITLTAPLLPVCAGNVSSAQWAENQVLI